MKCVYLIFLGPSPKNELRGEIELLLQSVLLFEENNILNLNRLIMIFFLKIKLETEQ